MSSPLTRKRNNSSGFSVFPPDREYRRSVFSSMRNSNNISRAFYLGKTKEPAGSQSVCRLSCLRGCNIFLNYRCINVFSALLLCFLPCLKFYSDIVHVLSCHRNEGNIQYMGVFFGHFKIGVLCQVISLDHIDCCGNRSFCLSLCALENGHRHLALDFLI